MPPSIAGLTKLGDLTLRGRLRKFRWSETAGVRKRWRPTVSNATPRTALPRLYPTRRPTPRCERPERVEATFLASRVAPTCDARNTHNRSCPVAVARTVALFRSQTIIDAATCVRAVGRGHLALARFRDGPGLTILTTAKQRDELVDVWRLPVCEPAPLSLVAIGDRFFEPRDVGRRGRLLAEPVAGST